MVRGLGEAKLNIRVEREKAARYGRNAGDVNAVVQAARGGTQAARVLEEDRQFALIGRVAPEYRNSLDRVRRIKVGVQTSGGTNAYIPLSELATLSLDTGASYIFHERNQRFIPIKFSVRGRDLQGTVADAQARIARQLQLPQGYRIEWAGEFEALQQARTRLAVIVPVSLALIILLLYALFNSLRATFLPPPRIPFPLS